MSNGTEVFSSFSELQKKWGAIKHMTSVCPNNCRGKTIEEIRDEMISGSDFAISKKIPFVQSGGKITRADDNCEINPVVHERVLFLLFKRP
ncbi:MAG: hypothetical protein WCV59_03370 [Parcubacteria group bacterium]